MSKIQFSDLKLMDALLKAVAEAGYTHPTPIQEKAIPPLLLGKDLLGCAQTGTGKTAAFTLPILQKLWTDRRRPQPKQVRALVLTPTRELALQIFENVRSYGKHIRVTSAVIFGGVGQSPQVQAVARGIDIVIATPGRLLDLMDQGHISLRDLEVFVLDEADRMLDMGFIHDVRKVVSKLPARRQSLFFSATMPPEIQKLASSLLTDPERVEVTPQATTVERIRQSILMVEKKDKKALLRHLLADKNLQRVIVFTRTKFGANQVSEVLQKNGISSAAIHGNKSQSARQKALDGFKSGQVRVLVATDIAARGIDIDGVTHVINFELPNEPESYVHRIGRTARAGADGDAVSFCDVDERAYLRDIERITRQKIAVDTDHPFHAEFTSPIQKPVLQQRSRPSRGKRPFSPRGGGSSGGGGGNGGRRGGRPGASRQHR